MVGKVGLGQFVLADHSGAVPAHRPGWPVGRWGGEPSDATTACLNVRVAIFGDSTDVRGKCIATSFRGAVSTSEPSKRKGYGRRSPTARTRSIKSIAPARASATYSRACTYLIERNFPPPFGISLPPTCRRHNSRYNEQPRIKDRF